MLRLGTLAVTACSSPVPMVEPTDPSAVVSRVQLDGFVSNGKGSLFRITNDTVRLAVGDTAIFTPAAHTSDWVRVRGTMPLMSSDSSVLRRVPHPICSGGPLSCAFFAVRSLNCVAVLL
jgi:hypothetical protein